MMDSKGGVADPTHNNIRSETSFLSAPGVNIERKIAASPGQIKITVQL
jgi:hypothetical protein